MMDVKQIESMAAEYTAAWNSKSAEAVASFYAEDGEIIINQAKKFCVADKMTRHLRRVKKDH